MTSAIFFANYCDRRHSQTSPFQALHGLGVVLFGALFGAQLGCEEMAVNLLGLFGKAPRITWAISRETGIDLRISSGHCRRTTTAH